MPPCLIKKLNFRQINGLHFEMAIEKLHLQYLTYLLIANPTIALADPSPEHTLPPMIVTPSDSETNGAEPPILDETRATTRLTQKDIQIAHERSIDEVLRGQAGIGITQGGSFGFGLIQARGVSGQGMLTLDGVPVPDSLPGVVNINAVLPDGMERVDIRRGFAPASRPFSALGGAIDLTSRTARDNSLDLRVEGGSFGFLGETLRANLATESARLAVSANRSDAFDGAYLAQQSNGNPERDPFHSTQALMKTGVDLSDSVTWEGSLLYRNSWTALDGYGIRDGRLAIVDQDDSFLDEQNWMAQNRLRAQLSDDWHSSLQLAYTRSDNHGRISGLNVGYTTELYLARWLNEQRVWRGQNEDAVHLVWGAEGRYEWAEAPTFGPPPDFEPGAPFDENRNQQAGFLETRFAYGDFNGDVGVRYESYSRFDAQVLFHAGAAWQISDTLKLRANGGNGFRIPSYAERLYPLLGNLALKPERGAGGDLGLKWQASSMLELSLTGFYGRYDDLIVVSWVPQPSAAIPCAGECISNVANATIAGLEAGGEIAFDDQWRGGVSYTYTDGRNLDNHRRLPLQAKSRVRMWGEWRVPGIPLTLWAEGVYRSLIYSDLDNTLDEEDAFRLNLHADYRLSEKFNLYVRGENVNDDRTPDLYNYDRSGTAVYGGLVWKIL